MIESEDERSSSEPEDNQEQVGHQILLMINKAVSYTHLTLPTIYSV